MKLMGMLDSPYVRRVAIALQMMDIPFEHESVSVFRHLDRFRSINPLVKAPTLICDDGTVLMDSTLLLEYARTLVPPQRHLMPPGAQALRQIGIALVAMEKSVQVYYEQGMRPAEHQHGPWLDRVTAQMYTAFDHLEPMVPAAQPWLYGARMLQPDIDIAVAWRFNQFTLPGVIDPARYPHLSEYSQRAEALPEFLATPLD